MKKEFIIGGIYSSSLVCERESVCVCVCVCARMYLHLRTLLMRFRSGEGIVHCVVFRPNCQKP